MGTVLIQFNRLKSGDRAVWRSYFREWLRYGYRPIFWSNWSPLPHGLDSVPYSFDRKSSAIHTTAGSSAVVSPSTARVWSTRSALQEADYGRPERNFDPTTTPREHSLLLQKLRPSLYLNFSGGDLYTGSARAIAIELGIPNAVLEKGFFGPTKMMDLGGTMGLSELCNLDQAALTKMTPEASLRSRGRGYLPTYLATFVPRANGAGASASQTELPSSDAPRILVMGSLDRCTGFSYPGEFKEKSLPGYADGFSIALETARRTRATVLYKPHPNEDPKSSWRDLPPNLVISWIDVRKAVEWADVVIGYGSGIDPLPVAMGKPLILAGRTFMSNKGVALEALSPEQLPETVERARTDKPLPLIQLANLEVFVGYLLDHYLYNDQADGPASRPFNQSIPDVLSRLGLPSQKGRSPSRRIVARQIDEILTDEGRLQARTLRRLDRATRLAMPLPIAVHRLEHWLANVDSNPVVLIDAFAVLSASEFNARCGEQVLQHPLIRIARVLRRSKGISLTPNQLALAARLPWILHRIAKALVPSLQPLRDLVSRIQKAGATAYLLNERGNSTGTPLDLDPAALLHAVILGNRSNSPGLGIPAGWLDARQTVAFLGRPEIASALPSVASHRIYISA